MMRTPLIVLIGVMLTACGGQDDPDALAGRLSEETRDAVFNSGLSGTIEKGQSVTLDASMTLTQTRIGCVGEQGAIAQLADCGDNSGWTSASAKIPLQSLETTSIAIGNPDRGRGEDGLFVNFVCRKEAGNCIVWTNLAEPLSRGSILCKTASSCAEAAQDLTALVRLAQPQNEPVRAQTGGAADLVARLGEEVVGATFNNGETGSIERHTSLTLAVTGAMQLGAEICVGRDGRTVDMARCGTDYGWAMTNATFDLREINPGSIEVYRADASRGESGVLVSAACWKYAGACVRWTAPVSDQRSLSLNCATESGCQSVATGLEELVRGAHRTVVEEADGVPGLVARMSALRRDLVHLSEGLATVKRGGDLTIDDQDVLHAFESSCVLENAEGLLQTCNDHPEFWANQEAVVALTDLDATQIEDSSAEPELLSYTFYLKCLPDRGDCITMTTTGAYTDNRSLSGTNLLCRDHAACGQMAADLVTAVIVNEK